MAHLKFSNRGLFSGEQLKTQDVSFALYTEPDLIRLQRASRHLSVSALQSLLKRVKVELLNEENRPFKRILGKTSSFEQQI